MKNIKFSVIIPVYNTSKYLKKCFDSLINQTYDNFEVIIVDDGSKDDSLDVCRAYEKKDKRFRVFSISNQGVSAARNFGLNMITGDYVTFLDSDDWLDDSTFESILQHLDKKDFDIIQCNLSIDYNNTKNKYFNLEADFEVKNKKEILESIISIKYSVIRYNNKYLNCRCAGGKFYKKEIVQKNNLKFPVGIKAFEDGIFNLYVYFYSNKVLILNDAFYHYVQYDLSSTSSYCNDQLEQNYMILSEIKKFIEISKMDLIDIYDYSVFELYYVTIDKIIRLQNHVSVKNKIQQMKNIYSMPVYSESINRLDKNNLTTIYKIVYILSMNDHYFLLYLLFILKKVIKKIRR